MLALFTGARRGNLQACRFDQLHLDQSEWHIPRTKSGKPQIVHLPPEAVAIFRSRQATVRGEWVFPSRRGSRQPYVTFQYKAWDRVCQCANLGGIRPHDLRRSLGSWLANTGTSLPIISKVLGHLDQNTTQIYTRVNVDPTRASVDSAVAAMNAAAKKATGGNTPRASVGD